jgi:hypothetical protein
MVVAGKGAGRIIELRMDLDKEVLRQQTFSRKRLLNLQNTKSLS